MLLEQTSRGKQETYLLEASKDCSIKLTTEVVNIVLPICSDVAHLQHCCL